jgi:hypothetical protein
VSWTVTGRVLVVLLGLLGMLAVAGPASAHVGGRAGRK